jgi:hypothetical protein
MNWWQQLVEWANSQEDLAAEQAEKFGVSRELFDLANQVGAMGGTLKDGSNFTGLKNIWRATTRDGRGNYTGRWRAAHRRVGPEYVKNREAAGTDGLLFDTKQEALQEIENIFQRHLNYKKGTHHGPGY